MAGSEDDAMAAAIEELMACADLLRDELRLDAEKRGQTHTAYVDESMRKVAKATAELRAAIRKTNMQRSYE